MSIRKVLFNDIYADRNSMGEEDQPIDTNILQHAKVSWIYFTFEHPGGILFSSFNEFHCSKVFHAVTYGT